MALLKLSPLVVMIVSLLAGIDVKVAACYATIYGVIIAMITLKHPFKNITDTAYKGVSTIVEVFFILMFSYALAEIFMATGVGASIIRISLSLGLNSKTVALVGFLVTCLLSIATGTSWGTYAACVPIFLWANHIVGGNVALTLASIIGGSCFGDNIGLLSDTTIVSSGIQEVEVIHRVRHQGVWSVMCIILSAILIYVTAVGMGLPSTAASAEEAINQIPEEAWVTLEEERPSAVVLLNQVREGVPVYMAIPLIVVVGLAFKGMPTLICLLSGIISAFILGLGAKTITFMSLSDLLFTGFSDAGNHSVSMMLWVVAFGSIMSMMNAFEPVAKFVLRICRNVRHLLFNNGLLCIFGNAVLADEMAQIVTIGPIIKNLTEENVEASEEDMYKLRLRNATLSDAMGVYSAQFFPWHCYVVYFLTIANSIYPLYQFGFSDVIRYNYMCIVSVASLLLLTITGLDRFIPLFKIPSEPQVRLKRKGDIPSSVLVTKN